MRFAYIIVSSIIALISCKPVSNELESNIAKMLQTKMTEINAYAGQVIVMDSKTGEVKAMVGDELAILESTTLIRPVSVMAALESGKVQLSDSVDVGDGLLIMDGDTIMRDFNWSRGGYGKITVGRVLDAGTNIGTYLTTKKAFAENEQAYYDLLDKCGVSVEKRDVLWNCIGYDLSVSPVQLLQIFNSIAVKEGSMPDGSKITSTTTIKKMKQVLRSVVTDGLGKPAGSDKFAVSGMFADTYLGDGKYCLQFCGYFPTESPQYTVLVTLNKEGLPASGGQMAGSLFKDVAEHLMK